LSGQKRLHPQDRVFALRAFQPAVGQIRPWIVGGVVEAEPEGDTVDQRGTISSPGPLDRVCGGFVGRQQVVAVHLAALQAIALSAPATLSGAQTPPAGPR